MADFNSASSSDVGEEVLVLALPHVRSLKDKLALETLSHTLTHAIRSSPSLWMRFHHLSIHPPDTSCISSRAHTQPLGGHARIVAASTLSPPAASAAPPLHHPADIEAGQPTARGSAIVGPQAAASQPSSHQGLPPTPAQQALSRAEWLLRALCLFVRRSRSRLLEVVLDGEEVDGEAVVRALEGCEQLELLSVKQCTRVQARHIIAMLQPNESTDGTAAAPPEGTILSASPSTSSTASAFPFPRLWQVRMSGTHCSLEEFDTIQKALHARSLLAAPTAALPVAAVEVCAQVLAVPDKHTQAQALRAGAAAPSSAPSAFPGARLQLLSVRPSLLDMDVCAHCAQVRAVVECTQRLQACRGCMSCIPRCVCCGSCLRATCILAHAQEQRATEHEQVDGVSFQLPQIEGNQENGAPHLSPSFSMMCGCVICSKDACQARLLTCVGCSWRCCPWHIEKYAEIVASKQSFVCEICSHQERDPLYDV